MLQTHNCFTASLAVSCIKYITEIVYVLGEPRAAWAASHLHVRDASLGSRSLFSGEIEVMAPFVT